RDRNGYAPAPGEAGRHARARIVAQHRGRRQTKSLHMNRSVRIDLQCLRSGLLLGLHALLPRLSLKYISLCGSAVRPSSLQSIMTMLCFRDDSSLAGTRSARLAAAPCGETLTTRNSNRGRAPSLSAVSWFPIL